MQHFLTHNLLSSPDDQIVSPNITLYPVWDNDFGISQVRLICVLSGYFPMQLSVEWYKNDGYPTNIIPNERKLMNAEGQEKTISLTTEIKPNMDDWKTGTNFTCKSTHKGSVFVKTTDICQTSLSIPPTFQIVIPSFKTVMTESLVKATCLVYTTFDAKVTWLLDKSNKQSGIMKQVSNTTHISSEVTVSSSEWKQLKTITCRAQHKCFSSMEKTVNVAGPSGTPPQIKIRRSFPELVKEDCAIFQCDISQDSSQDLYVTFQSNGRDILEGQYVDLPEGPGPHSVSINFLVPRNVWKTNTDFTCTVNQGFSSSSIKSHTISNIFAEPSIELLLAPGEVLGQQTLVCSGRGFNPQIKWLNGLHELHTSNHGISMDTNARVAVASQLHVAETEWKSGTVFICEVSDKSLNKVVKKEISFCSASLSIPPTFQIVIPSFKTVMTESLVKATCLVYTTFDAKVTWLLDKSNKQSGIMKQVSNTTHISSEVTVSSSEWKQLKTITCRAQHKCFSSMEKTVNVAGPSGTPPQIKIRRSFPELVKEDCAIFQCDISQDSSQDLYVTFQSNGRDILEGQYVDLPEGPGPHSVSINFLVPRNVWKTNTDFTCTVNQGFSSSSIKSHTISNIFAEPSIELLLAPEEVLGQQTLVCSGRGFNPQVKWFNRSKQITPSTYDISMNKNGHVAVMSQLHVGQTEWKRGMVFTCELSDSSLDKKVKKEISVCSVTPRSSHEAAIYVHRPALEELQNREQVTVMCLFVGTSLRDFSITWKVDGHPSSSSHIHTEKPVNHSNGTETLHSFLNVSAKDWYSNKQVSCEGKHLCSNKGYEDHISKSTDLSKPVLRIVKPTLTELYTFGTVTLTCLVSGFFPSDIIVQWEENGQRLPASLYINSPSWKEPATSYFSMSSRINVTKAEDNMSTYSCVVRHESSETPVKTSISDVFASVTYTKPSAILLQGENELVCLVSGFSPPSINITWFRSKTTEPMEYNTTKPYLGQDGKFSIQSCVRLSPIDSLPGVILTCKVTHEGATLSVNMSKPDTLEHCNFFDALKDTDVSQDALKETWAMALTFLCFFLFTIIFSLVVLISKVRFSSNYTAVAPTAFYNFELKCKSLSKKV
ncbi:uncharacterized protein LOC124862937 isoform X1 [Girardinichthys multiradiatus]|uniref:uncharacterized protein LOC124862937 isoform X1 n=1 Tax=Girardinichthys multiradiatus TaxID=208333 RepID=UPI001FAC5A9C|nr:uncharacterized protein LOC124862937 isoform X1 [Girardinichthys multiradiatus]